MNRREIIEELQQVLSGKTLDAVLPPICFIVINQLTTLNRAIVLSLAVALGLAGLRVMKKQAWQYAALGLAGVLFASGLSYLTQNATSYFLGSLISSAGLLLLTIISLLVGKPLAAWMSHLSRGWPLLWYWRKDVKPAYREVTILWLLMMSVRLVIQMGLYQQGNVARLGWTNTLLGWPVTLVVLILSYVYGVWRLRQLKGPGVEEFMAEKSPPWQGQTRGF
jgi:hypothetical protein